MTSLLQKTAKEELSGIGGGGQARAGPRAAGARPRPQHRPHLGPDFPVARARPRARTGLRGAARGRALRRRVPGRLPHPQPAARPLRRGRALRRLHPHLRARAHRGRSGAGLPPRQPVDDAAGGGAGRARDRGLHLRRAPRTGARARVRPDPGQDRDHGPAHAGDAAVPAAGLVRRGGDGDAERARAVRHAGLCARRVQPGDDRLGGGAVGRRLLARAGGARLGGGDERRSSASSFRAWGRPAGGSGPSGSRRIRTCARSCR